MFEPPPIPSRAFGLLSCWNFRAVRPRVAPLVLGMLLAIPAFPLLPWLEPGLAAAGERSGENITVAAASSLQGPFRELARAFDPGHVKSTLVFGASGSLAQQIANGAPYDVFASADEKWVEQLAARGRIEPESVTVYAVGRLALVTYRPQDMAGLPELLTARHLRLLTGPGIKVVALANPRYAPYGAAAREALRKAGLWERLSPRLVFGQNVRQTLTYVQSGNADAALVAASMMPRDKRPWPLISAALHPPIRMAVGRVSRTPRAEAAKRFIAFLLSAAGRDILRAYRLYPPSSPLPATKASLP